MNLCYKNALAMLATLALVCLSSAQGQAALKTTNDVTANVELLQPGVVVEELIKGYDAERSGLQKGDVLLTWSRGDAKGAVESPFTLWFLEVEQRPHGAVTVEGLRGSEKRAWTLGLYRWGIKSRPNFAEAPLSLYREGQELMQSGKTSQAEERWLAAAHRFSASRDSITPVWLMFHTAEEFSRVRQWQEADRSYRQALELARANGSALSFPLLRAWGASYSTRSDWASADACYQQALEEINKAGGESLLGSSFITLLGLDAWQHGDLPKAEEIYNQALAMDRRLAPESLDVANLLTNLATVISLRGDLDKAEQYYTLALSRIKEIEPHSRSLAASYANLGNLMLNRGDLDKAEQFYRQAVALQEEFGLDSPAYAEALGNLSLVTWQRGDLASAEASLLRVTTILQKALPDSANVARGFLNLGSLAVDRDEEMKAEKYIHQALVIEEKVAPGSLEVAYCLNDLANVALRRHALDRAEQYSLQSLEIQRKLAPDNREVSTAYYQLGQVARGRGDLGKAEQYDIQALAIQQKQAPGSLFMTQILIHLGDIASKAGNLVHAEEYDRQALAIRAKLAPGSTGHAEALAALAGVLAKEKKPDAAAKLYAQALNALESQTARLGGSDETRADFRAKHEAFCREFIALLIEQKQTELAFDVLERSRARTLLEVLASAHVDLVKGTDSAVLGRERSLQANLNAKSQRRIRLLGEKETKETAEQVKQVDKEINDLLSELQDVQSQLRSSSPGYAALTQPQPLSARQIQQQLLDSDTVLLAYSLGADRSHVFAVTPTSLVAVALPKREVIEKAARRVYDLLTARNQPIKGETSEQQMQRWAQAEAEYSGAAAELSRMVLGPVAAQLSSKSGEENSAARKPKRLLVVADGALQYIPFAMLPEPVAPASRAQLPSAQASRSLANAQPQVPLVVNHEVINLPSASVLAVLRRQDSGRKPAARAVAVIADPVFDQKDSRLATAARSRTPANEVAVNLPPTSGSAAGDFDESASANLLTRSATDLGLSRDGQLSLPRLLYSRQEADAIRAVTPAGEIKEAVDFQATRATAISPELRNYRIVHFATHGLLNSEHPELSGLVFSLVDENGQPQDGFLQLQDIYNLDLPADLVVLSACETGLGKEISGEGLIGLTRGFMYAGATRVVASLWNVSDVATAKLMAEFYRSMEKDHMPPAAALRAAQVSMWKQKRWNSPYYWAAFQIQGEWK